MIRTLGPIRPALAILALAGGARAEAPDPTAAALAVVPDAQRLTFVRVFQHAAPHIQLILAVLALAILASLIVWVLGRIGRPDRGRAFLATVARAAPLLGLAAAAYDLLKICLGLVNLRPTPDLVMIAPALAEAAMAVTLGLFAGAVAVTLRGALRAS